MVILDTNVISELFKPQPDEVVFDWIRAQPVAQTFTTAVTRGELLYGLNCLPDGRRKLTLKQGLLHVLDHQLAGHVLAFDARAADSYADIAARRRSGGRPVDLADGMIAGIAHSRGARLATRNLRDFEGCGVELVNPWAA